MLFNSIEFAFFLPIVFLLYWFVFNKRLRDQNLLLLIVSYFFYGWWDWRFLSLIAFSSVVDYVVGIRLSKTEAEHKRKLLLSVSLLVNLGFLGFFKYFNFFAENFANAFTLFGQPFEPATLNIILPVGISFYTFQTLSYTIDIYRKKLTPTTNAIQFFAFVSFFPQLVAGPIERAGNLLPQFSKYRSFEYVKAADGMKQILWGLFKKVVIADNCAVYVNDIFSNYSDYSGSTLLLGGVLFAFQIYGDFSGYSDIAIGTARLFGFHLMKNFAFPYFSRDIAEFWRRWHISLSTWFRDYLYIPLGGSRGPLSMQVRNIFIIFIVSGFWHGANWTFIVWGALNAAYFLPLLLMDKNRQNLEIVSKGRLFPSIKEFFSILSTFLITVLGWIFFRAESVQHAIAYLAGIMSPSIFSLPEILPLYLAILIAIFITIEWIQREQEHGLSFENRSLSVPFRWSTYLILAALVASFFGTENSFIYFQF